MASTSHWQEDEVDIIMIENDEHVEGGGQEVGEKVDDWFL